jgi:hypothetical protein
MLHKDANAKKAHIHSMIGAVRSGPVDFLNINPLSITYNNPAGDYTNKG